MIKKPIYILLMLFLVSCGNTNTANLGVATKGTAATKATASLPDASLRTILARAEDGGYRPGELLVKFRSGVDASSAQRTNSAVGARKMRRLSSLDIEQVKLPAGLSVQAAITQYMQDPNVEYAEPNYLRFVESYETDPFFPDDPYFVQEWGMWNTGIYAGGVSGADVKAPLAWTIARGTRDVVIAVLDSGIDYNHPDLRGNIWLNPGEVCPDGIDNDSNGFVDDCQGWNFVSDTNDPLDDIGHGTIVAGIIGAVGNDHSGVTGMMWRVQLMPLKTLDSSGAGTVAEEVAAIDYVMLMKSMGTNVRLMNASFGSATFSNAEYTAIRDAGEAGILLIASAGNGNSEGVGINDDHTPHYPSSFGLDNIISVAATDQRDNLASFSNFGLSSVDVGAPGVYILSTVPIGLDYALCTAAATPGYNFCNGTSFSAPFVTGLAGLLDTAYPNFSSGQIRSTILRYVDVVPSLENRVFTSGRINAFKAVSSLMTPTDVTAEADEATSVTVTWTDNATGEDGYTVDRKTGGGAYVQIASLPADSTSYTDTTVIGNTTYTYRVKAFNTIPATSTSVESNAVTTPEPPPSATGGAGGGCSVGGPQNFASGASNAVVFLMPLLVLLVARNLRRRKK